MGESNYSLVEGPQDQVFINFRGADLRSGFVSHLVEALKKDDINVFIDENEGRGKKIDELLKRIEKSRIALPIFSARYTDSEWCLRELAKIKECEEKHKLVAIPIFYKLEPATVKGLRGPFGDAFRDLARGDERREEWKEALQVIPQRMGFTLEEKSKESKLIKDIVKAVKNVLSSEESEYYTSVDNSKTSSPGAAAESYSRGQTDKTFGNEQRMKELKEKMDLKDKGTRFIGVVGMPGIGKTTLLKELYKKLRPKFTRHVFIDRIREKLKGSDLEDFPPLLLDELELKYPETDVFEEPYEELKRRLEKHKVLLVLDDVSTAKQIHAVLGEFIPSQKPEWIKEGSRVVIATNDMSLTESLVHDTYVVPQLNHRDGLRLFCCHAFEANCPKGEFTKLSDEFVHYARGHPLAIQILGTELRKKNIKHWVEKLDILARNPSTYIGEVLQVSYGELSPQQKDAFLDIACFRSENVDYVESLLASTDPKAADTTSAVKVLRNKFLINTCDGRVEMHDLLYTFSRELDPKASTGSRQRRLWLPQDIIKGGVINIPNRTMKAANVRGIFLDLYDVKNETSLESDHFSKMHNLRYLKFYNSHCPQECKTNNKINIPDGLTLPLKEVRCLHWLKFPLEELPDDFNPIKLVDLKLPYSGIERLWEGVKDTPALKWVDLCHSSKLSTLSGLSEARNLQRLNLEGCTSLESLGDVKLISLKALILSNCSNFNEFPFVSKNIEFLYLDGTAIRQVPDEMLTLQRLVLLNMKDCRKLKNISTCVGELKALQKLILSGCLKLKHFPEINKSSLNILLLDGTSIKTIPQLPSSLQYLSLGRNDQISCLPDGINQLSHLTWLDLKYCKSITSIPELPPNLHYLDAHGCSSLKTVAQPLARIVRAMQNHCTFSFTNCSNLEQAAKEEITSYAQRKCHLLSDARKHYNGGLVSEALFSICFPGCEVPSWFCHDAVGSRLERKLLPHWHAKSLSGIALCAVVSFPDKNPSGLAPSQDQISCISVTCTFKIKVEDKSWIPFTCPVGSWTKEGDKKDKMESDHVFVAYISCPYTIRCLEDENSDKCSFTESSLEFNVAGGGTSDVGKFKVLRCGLSFVYGEDINENSCQNGMMEEEREPEKQEVVMDDQRSRSQDRVEYQTCSASIVEEGREPEKQEVAMDDQRGRNQDRVEYQTCSASITPIMEDKISGQANA